MNGGIKYVGGWELTEIIHQPVTFTKESLQKDNDALNEAIHNGYQITELVRTETGIVYVLGKWTRRQITEKTAHEIKQQPYSWKKCQGEEKNEK